MIPEHQRESPWLEHYQALRTAISNYEIGGYEPRLEQCSKPEGGFDWDGPDQRPIHDILSGNLPYEEASSESFEAWLEALMDIV